MASMIKVLACVLVLLVLAVPAWSQGSPNSVAQLIASKSTAANGLVNITPQNNIGQNSHQIFIYTSDTGGGCSTGAFTGPANIDGSIDNVTFKQISTDITQPINLLSNSQPYVGFAVGVYPYLRVSWTNNNPANCQVTIWYTGSVSPQAYSGSPRTVNDQFVFLPFNVSTIGDNNLQTNCPGVTLHGSGVLALYGLYLYNQTAGQNITVKLANTVTGMTTYVNIPAAPANYQFLGMPNTGKPHYIAYSTVASVQVIDINLSAATAVTGYATYRCE